MKKLFLLAAAAFFFYAGKAQSGTDSGTLILHKFAQAIGKETYTAVHRNGQVSYDIHFKFTDRGQAVPIEAQLLTTESGDPLSMKIKGQTSRFSSIDESVKLEGGMATITRPDSVRRQAFPTLSFPVGSYAPGTIQQALIRFWKQHGAPGEIQLMPAGSVTISHGDKDTFRFQGKPLALQGYTISGLIWGNELAWCDDAGKLVCLITNDAEGDKVEMVSEKYEALLPQLISRAAKTAMALFAGRNGKIFAPKTKILAITGATLIDVNGKASMPNSVVVVEDGIIKQVGKMGEVKIPSSARVIDAKGKTLLPGLWDMHAHFEQAEWGPAYLAAGVTTVRDCGNELVYINAIQQAIDAGLGVGPHILKAGIIDGPGPMGLGIVRASNKKEAIDAVRRYKADGFVQIKIYSSIEPAVLKYICDEAHRLGMSVTGHIPESMGLIQAIDSGMNQVNHVQYIYAAMKRRADRSVDQNDSASKAILYFLRENDIVVDPTLGVFEMVFRSENDDIRKLEPNFSRLPVSLQEQFKNTGMPAAQAEKYQPLMQSLMQIVKALHNAGIPIVAGTDMGFPGTSLHRELELYVAAGLTPLEAIQTATIVPARVMGRDSKTGSIAVGKSADLLLVDGDPLLDISNIRKVSVVIKGGEDYYPGTLRQLAGFGH